MTDYSQLAQAKAEKKYPIPKESERPKGSQNEYTEEQREFDTRVGEIGSQQYVYIDCLNDVKALYELSKRFVGMFTEDGTNIGIDISIPVYKGCLKTLRQAIANFEGGVKL